MPEDILGKIAVAVVNALHYLHSKLHVIHRDVKPSNILINRKGEVKMCDFGISGYLVDSVAKTIDAGCKPYMVRIFRIKSLIFKEFFLLIGTRANKSCRKWTNKLWYQVRRLVAGHKLHRDGYGQVPLRHMENSIWAIEAGCDWRVTKTTARSL